jgi:HSP20 family protein
MIMPIMRWDRFGILPRRWFGAGDLFEEPLAQWWPSMDIYSKGNDLVIRAEVPGARAEDIDIHLDDDILTISGKRAHEEEVSEENFYRKECAYGSFCRTIPLPKGTKEDDVSAKLKDGVLEVVVKGAGKAIPPRKKIPIQRAD